MGFFDKKYCDICGEKIGLLGNRKLEDGNLCKSCAKKLSPWFSDRKNSTVTEIKDQLAYREENRKKVAQFRVTSSFGENMKVLIDEMHRWFMVTRADDLQAANPDVIEFSALADCTMNIDERRSEIMRTDKDGKRVSYHPPRYEFSYEFNILIRVNTPYFDAIKFKLNSFDVRFTSEVYGTGGFFGSGSSARIDPTYNIEYRKYMRMGEELCDKMREIRHQETNTARFMTDSAPAAAPTAAASPAFGPWNCPACGASNGGKFCECCGTPRPQ